MRDGSGWRPINLSGRLTVPSMMRSFRARRGCNRFQAQASATTAWSTGPTRLVFGAEPPRARSAPLLANEVKSAAASCMTGTTRPESPTRLLSPGKEQHPNLTGGPTGPRHPVTGCVPRRPSAATPNPARPSAPSWSFTAARSTGFRRTDLRAEFRRNTLSESHRPEQAHQPPSGKTVRHLLSLFQGDARMLLPQ